MTGAFDTAQTRSTLFRALMAARKQSGGKIIILEDHSRKRMSYDEIVRASFVLGERLRKLPAINRRVAVLMPTSIGGALAFFALQAAGRVPVLLNFSAGVANLRSACRSAGVLRMITSRAFVEIGKLGDLVEGLSADVEPVYLEDIRESLTLSEKIVGAAKAAAGAAPDGAPDDVGAILFTSGSFGDPKGVLLSHANLLANVFQIERHIELAPDWSFFSPLPIFHSYGLTGGLLLPLLTGRKAFLYPSPLHFKEIPQLIAESGANILLATDTFASQYARSAKGDGLKCLKYCVLGAERVREETRELYRSRFQVELLEGYGVTETSPVLTVNQPGGPNRNRQGTAGKLLPGVEARLEPIPGIDEGRKLVVRGPNVMLGYLKADGGVETPEGGWHDTGDVVAIDADGFVRILGRVKRFAKIGGEMVSLNAVEATVSALWPERNHAVVALPCDRKGERLVLVSDAQEADVDQLLTFAKSQGAADIAVPRKLVRVEQVPILASGKTDYVTVRKLAENALSSDARAA